MTRMWVFWIENWQFLITSLIAVAGLFVRPSRR
jgi:hypothetical protein